MVSKTTIRDLQRDMKSVGVYSGNVDGSWGPLSHGAFLNARRLSSKSNVTPPKDMSELLFMYCKSVAWSNNVSDEFIAEVKRISKDLDLSFQGTDELMSCMAFESGGTFSPTIQNGAGAPYYGIIQFGAAAAKDAGTSIPALLKMTNVQQVQYVYNFFKPYKGKLKGLSDMYLRILYPVAVGKPEDYVLFSENGRGRAYAQNHGLDVNRDGKITKGEAAAKVMQKLVEGLHPKNLRTA
ncbi:hypothetical protein D3C85_13520 [compost metagenome]